jgi:hypothetical protein
MPSACRTKKVYGGRWFSKTDRRRGGQSGYESCCTLSYACLLATSWERSEITLI